MHQNLEKRLRGSLLAVGIGVGSLFGNGCATNNPALNAFMNYGVAPILAADAGRSQQTVVVNQNSTPIYSSTKPWKLFTAEHHTSFQDIRGMKTMFFTDESFVIVASNGDINKYLRLEVLDAKGTIVRSKEDRSTSPYPYMGIPHIKLEVSSNTLSPGSYFFNAYNEDGLKGNSSFKVQSRLSVSQ